MHTLEGPRLNPLSGRPAQQLVILLHGYGADGNDLIELAKIWQPRLVNAAFIAPHGPAACELSPFGRQWFSLRQYDPEEMRRNPDLLEQGLENLEAGAFEAQKILEPFVEKELSQLSLEMKDLVLVGFSQGTMIALHSGLRQKNAPAGILGYSGALVGAKNLARDTQSRPPVTLIHGEQDDILPYAALGLAERGLKAADVKVDTHTCPNLGHSIDERGLSIGGSFLQGLFKKPKN
ncbi:MAG: dienelactone hydrolase family protein [Sneathiella sp.]|nr:dienelactone hydrolase family protein [Sneathiella sp.]